MSSKNNKHRLKISPQNSRINFGSLIFEAAKQGDWEGLDLILSQDGVTTDHVNYKDRSGRTPLFVAAKHGFLKCVRLLLGHKCDLFTHVRIEGRDVYAWDIALKHGNDDVVKYLNGCVDDLPKFKYHRAMMEADVRDICRSPKVSTSDIKEFDQHLEKLIKFTSFNINGDEYTDSLLIIAAKADNQVIVKKLLEEYHATPYANDLKTGETALHLACKLSSPLRFYITQKCPDLIFAVDVDGDQPLHIACQNNDVKFVTWLFQTVLEQMEKAINSLSTSTNPFYSLQPPSFTRQHSPRRISHPDLKQLSPPSNATSFDLFTHSHRQLSLHESIEEEEETSDCSPVHEEPLKSTLQQKLFGIEESQEFIDHNIHEEDKPSLLMTSKNNNFLPFSSDPEQPLHPMYTNQQISTDIAETDKETFSVNTITTPPSIADPIVSLTSSTNDARRRISVYNKESSDELFQNSFQDSNSTDGSEGFNLPIHQPAVQSVDTKSDNVLKSDVLIDQAPTAATATESHVPIVTNSLPHQPTPIVASDNNVMPLSPQISYNNSKQTSVEDSFLFSNEVSMFIDSTSKSLQEMSESYGRSPFNFDTLLSVHMRLFAINTDGSSILHIIARHGHNELLRLIIHVAKYLEHNPDGADINVLTRRESSLTPIEEAIDNNNIECLKLLLGFACDTPIFDVILNDELLLSRAVKANSVDSLNVLLEFGIWKGVSDALKVALKSSNSDLLRRLIFYYTQVLSVTQGSRVKRNRHVTIDTGVLRWNELELDEVKPPWFQDASLAITTVSYALRVKTVIHPVQESRELFQSLGKDCTEYFSSHIWQPQAHPKAWAGMSITEVDLSSNKLVTVPPETFQIETLVSLNLSKNKIQALQSSVDFQHPLYKCTNLKKLDLNTNDLRTLPEDLFYAVGNSLEELDVHNNQIESLPPGLWICTRLHTLSLARNKLSQLHYFSDVKYFYDHTYSHDLISSLHVDHGVLVKVGKASDEEFMKITNYVTHLNVFFQTVKKVIPNVIENENRTSDSLIQHVVDIHWLRCKLNRDQTIPLNVFDIGLPPDEVCSLTQLDLSQNQFTQLPWDLACLAPNLEKLDLRGNMIQTVDLIRDMPANIASIILSENKLSSVTHQRLVHPCGSPVKLLAGYLADPKTRGYCRHTNHCLLDKLTNLILSNNHITSFPCTPEINSSQPLSSQLAASFEKPQPYFPNLSVLSLDQNSLEAVPTGVHHLTQLSSLTLSHNHSISRLPPEMGVMNPQILLILKLEGVFPKNVDSKLLTKPGARAILTYLKSLYHKSQPYYRIKLMFIGNSNVGKTSLLLNLTRKGKVTRFKEVEKGLNKRPLSTVGVDLGDWEYPTASRRPKVTFMTWDFGGQEEYYATHQCFLTQRSLYILVWNAQDREKGLDSLRPWLENIGSRVPGAPVIVVATHLDGLPAQKRNDILKQLKTYFEKSYLNSGHTHLAYPDIYHKCFFVSCNDGTQISQLRDELYEFALSIKPANSSHRKAADKESLLQQPVPECYIKLQDIVRDHACKCIQEKKPPILNRREFRQIAFDGNFPGKLDELEQGTAFLHENGILLHYEDPALSDLYFVDPQWLCTMLACVVTVQEKNPFQKNGFMEFSALQLVLRNERFPPALLRDFVSLMQKFEVVLLLDTNHMLIPSLLPGDEDNACVVFPLIVSIPPESSSCISELSCLPFAKISTLDMTVFARFYLLPFIPNGFFPRLLARVIGSKITLNFSQCVPSTISKDNIFNCLHWKCWRNGIVLIHHHMEIIRIAPTFLPRCNIKDVFIHNTVDKQCVKNIHIGGIEIMVAVLPEDLQLEDCDFLPCDNTTSLTHRLSVWILRQLTEIVDSVFDDWYEGFARRKGFDLRTVQQVSPCPKCLTQVFKNYRHNCKSPSKLSLFTSPCCVLAASKNLPLNCDDHGSVPVSSIAPDLAFSDLPYSMLYHKSRAVVTKLESLGSGGFSNVYKGIIEGELTNVAIKEFSSFAGAMIENPTTKEETTAWDVYLNGSREAHMMYQLKHPNILRLVGLAFEPLRLLLELAPMGDLKACLKPFKSGNIKLNRRILKNVMYQVADAMEYIHSKNIIYRDLKPGNVLVWEFPEPKTQWNLTASVLIKLADYGISKHCTPEGARGSEGTPAFLPPEVILHGGTASFTTQLDVYSYGMFLYYLFTYMGPFENEKSRPISALLDEGRRPELSLSHRPTALQMYELMCWCWSDKPQHRPTFTQIKEILSSNTFTQLLDNFRITVDDDNIQTACVHSFKQNLTRKRNAEDNLSEKRLSASPSPSILSLLAASSDEENIVQVYYGTGKGKVGVIRFQSAEPNCETIDQLKCLITSIIPVGRNIWVGTWGKGVLIYDTSTNECSARWGVEISETVYKLLYVKESGLMFVLSGKGLVLLETNFNRNEGVVNLQSKSLYPSEHTLTTGVVLFPRGGLEESEVWCCAIHGEKFKIFSGIDFKMHGVKEIPIPMSDLENEPCIQLIECYERDNENKIVLADRQYLQFWDAITREKERADFDCHSVCNNIHENANRSSVTSLLVDKGLMYVGTVGGTVIVLHTITLEVLHFLRGYRNEVISILSLNREGTHLKRFSRLLSKRDSFPQATSPVFPEMVSLSSSGESYNSDRNLVLTFGRGYRGVVGDYENHPPSFTLPLITSSTCSFCRTQVCSCGDSLRSRLARPPSNIGCVLYWSNEEQVINSSIDANNRFSIVSCSTIPETSETLSSSVTS